MKKLKMLGERRVRKLVKKALRKEAIRMLRELGYRSACKGACARRMKIVTHKIKEERKKNEIKITKLTKFKKTVVVQQLK